MRISTWVCAFVTVCGCACGLSEPRSGELISDERPLVARARFELRVRHTDLVEVDVVYPSESDGTPARLTNERRAALVFVQGGFVPIADYEWLAIALARRGYVVALPAHAANLAILSIDNAAATRDFLVTPPESSLLEGLVDEHRIAIAGHSLGGVVALEVASSGGYQAVSVLASYPEPSGRPALSGIRAPILALAAERDCQAKLADVEEKNRVLPEPRVLAVVEGAGHFQFTSNGEEDAARGCPPDIALDVAHARIEQALAAFLDAAMKSGGTGEAAIDALDGVHVRALGETQP